MQHHKEVSLILRQMGASIRAATTASLADEGHFTVAARAALAKSYEINRAVFSASGKRNSYALTASLRGICEDIISLSFWATLDDADRDRVVELMMFDNVQAALENQSAFFEKNRPSQPVLTPKDAGVIRAQIRAEMSQLRKRY